MTSVRSACPHSQLFSFCFPQDYTTPTEDRKKILSPYREQSAQECGPADQD
jgi:hypothetical protein